MFVKEKPGKSSKQVLFINSCSMLSFGFFQLILSVAAILTTYFDKFRGDNKEFFMWLFVASSGANFGYILFGIILICVSVFQKPKSAAIFSVAWNIISTLTSTAVFFGMLVILIVTKNVPENDEAGCPGGIGCSNMIAIFCKSLLKIYP